MSWIRISLDIREIDDDAAIEIKKKIEELVKPYPEATVGMSLGPSVTYYPPPPPR